MIAVDFETYYDDSCSVVPLGYWHYPRHKDFEAYLVSVFGEGIDFCGSPKDFDWSQLDGKDLVSHNTAFDESVTNFLIESKAIPKFIPRVWEDTLDLSAYVSGARSLKDAANLMLGASLSKDVRNKLKGKRWGSLSAEAQAEVIKYARDDTKYCLCLWEEFNDEWPEHERWISRANRYAGMKGVPVDVAGIDVSIKKAKELMRLALLNIPWSDDEDEVIMSIKKVAKHCREVGIEPPASMAQDSQECIAWEDKYGEKYPFVAALRQYRKANILFRKLEVMQNRTRPDGWMGYELKYFGATTGRLTGSTKFNIQNLPRKEWEGIDLRKMIAAPEGYVFVASDFSQVEPRCLNWLAGNTEFLDMIRKGYGIYHAFAIKNGICPPDQGADEFKQGPLYQMVKAMVIGCGYGMGPAKFVASAPVLTGGKYKPNMAEATKAVALFKRANPKVVSLWKRLEKEFIHSAARKESYEVGLPSGRSLVYSDISSVGGWSCKKTKAAHRTKVWYGILIENTTQATAYDVMSHAWRKMVDAGINVIFTVHDEIVALVKESDASETMARMEAIMRTSPEWMPNIPLDAESKILKQYEK